MPQADRQERTVRAARGRPAPGQRFPDLELSDHYGNVRQLLDLAGGDPLLMQLYRGVWCPVEPGFVGRMPMPVGPGMQRYAGSPWPRDRSRQQPLRLPRLAPGAEDGQHLLTRP